MRILKRSRKAIRKCMKGLRYDVDRHLSPNRGIEG
jgi:hypothetical protein